MRLVMANKLYSSWSLRPWLLMRAFDIPFEETVVPLRQDDTANAISQYSPSGKVPVLVDGDVVVWESLAIISYLTERFPQKSFWPDSRDARAHAVSISHEMHGGFQALRQACPMNLGKRFVAKDWEKSVLEDVARIEALWRAARMRFGDQGPYLFGAFGAADAMFAPVVCRLDGYLFDVEPETRVYMEAILAHPAFISWRKDALKEPWEIAAYEEGHVVQEVVAGTQ